MLVFKFNGCSLILLMGYSIKHHRFLEFRLCIFRCFLRNLIFLIVQSCFNANHWQPFTLRGVLYVYQSDQCQKTNEQKDISSVIN